MECKGTHGVRRGAVPAIVAVAAWVGIVAFAGAVHAHPNSLSRTRVTSDGASLVVVHRAQTLTWAEACPALDRDQSGDLDRTEIAAGSATIAAYWTRNVQWTHGADARSLEPSRVTVAWAESPFDPSSPFRTWSWLSVEAEFSVDPESIDRLGIDFRAYFETSPDHVDYCTIRLRSTSEGEGGALFALDEGHPHAQWVRGERPRSLVRIFFVGGWQHILEGWDHLAFLAALLLGAVGLRSLLLVMTAFTTAHAVTLSLAATGAIDTRGYGHLVEMAIALSVAYVAVDQWVHRRDGRTRWVEAFFFGAIHGLGFAGYLREALPEVGAMVIPLASFHFGIEAGQAVVLVTAAFIVRSLPGERERTVRSRVEVGETPELVEGQPFLVPRRLRGVALVAVAALGFYWFLERV